MTVTTRWLFVASGLLALGLAVQTLLLAHLAPATPEAYPGLRRPLSDLPLTLTGPLGKPSPAQNGQEPTLPVWMGTDHPHLAQLREVLTRTFGSEPDDLLSRAYQLRGTDLVCSVYAVHSRIGEDRKHHPEICIREVTGAPEDLTGRQILHLGGDPRRPVQRFRFRTGTQQATTVYYWHYTFTPAPEATRSLLQRAHLLLGYPAPSVTVQVAFAGPVATALSPERLDLIEQSLLPLLDGQLASSLLPPSARMACDRMPITLIRR